MGLWNILADNKTFHGDTSQVNENSYVKLELTSETKLRASLIENDTLLKTMNFKGKVVDDYFSIKKKLILIPIPALVWYRERKTIIGNDKNRNLILTRAKKNGAWILFMAADGGGITSYEFESKTN